MTKLYFIGSAFGGVLKIGISDDVEARLKALQDSNPFELSLFAVFRPRKAAHKERELHDLLAAHRTRGEWFLLNAPVREVVKVAQRTTRIANVVKEARRQRQAKPEMYFESINSERVRCCAFCGRSHIYVPAMVGTESACICSECLTLCTDALAANTGERSAQETLEISRADHAIAALETRNARMNGAQLK